MLNLCCHCALSATANGSLLLLLPINTISVSIKNWRILLHKYGGWYSLF